MSAPTRQFRNLSLGQDMPITRGQAQRLSSEAQPDESSSSSRENSDEEVTAGPSASRQSSPPGLIIRGRSTINYRLREFPPASYYSASTGLSGTYQVEQCWTTAEAYVFNLTDHVSVHLRAEEMVCDCVEFNRSPGRACRHIFWVVDQLYPKVLDGHPAERGVILYPNGLSNLGSIYELLGGNLETAAAYLRWPVESNEARRIRGNRVRDILSTFHTDTLPEEFRADIYDSIEYSRTPDACLRPQDLEGTLFQLAVSDIKVYNALDDCQPSQACGLIYYGKMGRRITTLFAEFDEYKRRGTRSADRSRLEVDVVAHRLGEFEDRVATNMEFRGHDGIRGAVSCLITILQGVFDRDEDAFRGASWRRAPRHETDADRNLYTVLVRRPATEAHFVLDTLARLPPDILNQHSSALRDLQVESDKHRMPDSYKHKLQTICRDISRPEPTTEATRESASAGQKRRAGGNARGAQKRPK